MNRKKMNRKKNKEKIIMVTMIAIAMFMVLLATAVVILSRWIVEPDLPTLLASGSPSASGDIDLDIDAVEPLASGDRRSNKFRTILVFGTDETSGLTDTIMVVSYDITNQRATVMSIPRDTLLNVEYRDSASKSINAVYKLNGIGESGTEALKREVSKLIGFMPDYYITIDWALVGKMVDAIGGVYFDIPWHMGYDDDIQDLHIHFEEGYQYLDGKDAMNLVRWRKNNDGTPTPGGGSDLSRLNIQHNFLKVVLKQTLQPQNALRIGQLAELLSENVISDLTVGNMFWFGSQAVSGGLSVDDVNFVTMPNYGVDIEGARFRWKVCPSINQLLTLINESLNPYVEEVTLRQLDLIQISADGNTLSSTTGKLADPSAGIPPTTVTRSTESKPVESDPVENNPIESDPVETAPVESDLVESEPSESDPPEDKPIESDLIDSLPADGEATAN